MANRIQLWLEAKKAEIQERFKDELEEMQHRLNFLAQLPKMEQGKMTDEMYFYRLAQTEHFLERDLLAFDLVKMPSQELWKLIKKQQNKTERWPSGYKNTQGWNDLSRKYPCRMPRECAIILFGYQMPWPENIQTLLRLANGRQILEIGAGRALWARFLAEGGANIVCADDHSWNGSTQSLLLPPYYPVESLDWLAAVKKYSEAGLLLMIWPPPGHSKKSPAGLLEAVKEFRGEDIVLVGELGDLTGGHELYEYLSHDWCQRLSYTNKGEGKYTQYPVFMSYMDTTIGMWHFKKKKKYRTIFGEYNSEEDSSSAEKD